MLGVPVVLVLAPSPVYHHEKKREENPVEGLQSDAIVVRIKATRAQTKAVPA